MSLIRFVFYTLLTLVLPATIPLRAQIPGNNVNMVSGTQWPGGDPFLQRQNEPSMAVSSRNPLHMLAGANDYRTVDLPGVAGSAEPTGDAWLGLFKSFDGGQSWTSTLVPGYPQDQSLQGILSPLKGLGAAADPGVRAGTNGMFYYSGLGFNRQAGGASRIFVASFIDDNNLEGGDTIRYLWTTVAGNSTTGTFEDKPSLAVDTPRPNSSFCVVPSLPLRNTQIFRAGTVYVGWTEFTGSAENSPANILFSRSLDCGLTWSPPRKISGTAKINQGAALAIDPNSGAVYLAWRVFASTSPSQTDAIMYAASFDGGNTFSKPAVIANISPFDQGDTAESLRTNAYPAMAVDAAGRVYVAWSQRGAGLGGDARIVVTTGSPTSIPHATPLQWSAATVVDPWSRRGHQIMPAVAFSAGKLTVAWYDLRDDDLIAVYSPLGGGQYSFALNNDGGFPDFPTFGTFIQDPIPPYTADARRQTLDVRAAQAMPASPASFLPSVQVSQYAFGSTADNPNVIQQLEVNAPNLPMFQSGTLAFFGDYIDIAGPTFIANPDGTWRYNNQPADPDFTHVVWTDNRNVVQPADGNWANYTPPTYGTSATSIFDSTQQRPACTMLTTGNTRDRNQDIYTAQLSPGLVVSARGNAKPLGTGSNGQLIQREFPVTLQNTTTQPRFYQLTISSQPAGGAASFLQFPVAGLSYPFTQIAVQVPALSSTSRSMFVTSTDPHAAVLVHVAEIAGLNGIPVPGGQTGSVTVNSDVSNPNISNPNISNPNISNTEIYNPNISNPNISNPNISNPNISNPNISNPNISNPNISNVTVANPNISNPNISNPNISNPNISNPNISNPNISNPNISNAALTDATWTVTNQGNTAAAYSVKMLAGQNAPPGVTLQLIISQSYNTPSVIGCAPAVTQHFVPVANIPNVVFYSPGALTQPAATDPTVPAISLLPGESAFVTMRVLDTTTSDPAQALQHYNPATATAPAIVAQGANTGTTTPPVALVILPVSLPPATVTGAYSRQLAASGGTGTYTWSVTGGTLPAGIQLMSNGSLQGTPTNAGSFVFTVKVTDGTQTASTQLTLLVNPAPAIALVTLPTTEAGQPYSRTISATGGTGALTFTPLNVDGVMLTPSGAFAGTPLLAGTFPFTATVTDALNVSGAGQFTLTVLPAVSLAAASLSGADQGTAYQQQAGATGGLAPYGSWTWLPVAGSSLPPGLSLDASTGTVTGTPTATGTYSFTVSMTDALGFTASRVFSITVNLPPALSGGTLPPAAVGTPYASTIPVANGTAPFAWSDTGVLPAGLSFANGVISGTTPGGSFAPPYDPAGWTASGTNGGSTSIAPNCLVTVNVTDAAGASAMANFGVGSTPSSSCTTFGYAIDLNSTPGSGCCGGGVSARTWTFQSTAASTGTLSFQWRYIGFHAYFEVTAQLQVFSGANATTLYSAGPADCCTTPSAAFDLQGSGTIAVTQGQPFGFIVGGSNGDSNSVLNGTLVIYGFSIQ